MGDYPLDDLICIRVDADVRFFHDGIDIPDDCLDVAEGFVIRNESLCYVSVKIGGSRFQVEAVCDWERGHLKGMSLHWVEDCVFAEALRKKFEASYQRIWNDPPDNVPTEQVDVYFDPPQKVISIGSVPKERDWLSQLVIPHRNVIDVVSFALDKLRRTGSSRIARAISLATEWDYCFERLLLDAPLLDRCGTGRIKPELLTEYEDVLNNPWGYVLLADTSNLNAKAFAAWAKEVGFSSRKISDMLETARQNCLSENEDCDSQRSADKQSSVNDIIISDGHFRFQSVDDDIRQNYASGFDFKATSWRLIEKRTGVHLSRSALNGYKKLMFERPDGLHFFPDMILDEKSSRRMLTRADELLSETGMFSLETLMSEFENEFRNISDVGDFKAFFNQFVAETIGGTVRGHVGWYMCFPAAACEEESWKIVASRVHEVLVNAGDAVSITDLVAQLPYLSLEIVLRMGVMHIPDAVVFGVEGNCYLKLLEFFYLPDDFGTALAEFIRSTEASQSVASIVLIEGMLNARYGESFRTNYGLDDESVFKQVVAKSTGLDGYGWKRDIYIGRELRSKANVAEMFLMTHEGLFHEEEFFKFAEESRGMTNRGMLICTFLRKYCIRMSKDWWLPTKAFDETFNLTEEQYSQIGDCLNNVVSGKGIYPIANLPQSALESLPQLQANDRRFDWNPYLLTSVAVARVKNATVVNDDPSPYTVTAFVVPPDVERPSDVVEYALGTMPKGYFSDAEAAFQYLKANSIRMTRTDKLMSKISAILGC